MEYAKIIGLVAGLLTTSALVPQVFKTWKTRSARDISLRMLLMTGTGMVLWLVYGILINDLPLMLWNIISVSLVSILAYFRINYHKKPS